MRETRRKKLVRYRSSSPRPHEALRPFQERLFGPSTGTGGAKVEPVGGVAGGQIGDRPIPCSKVRALAGVDLVHRFAARVENLQAA